MHSRQSRERPARAAITADPLGTVLCRNGCAESAFGYSVGEVLCLLPQRYAPCAYVNLQHRKHGAFGQSLDIPVLPRRRGYHAQDRAGLELHGQRCESIGYRLEVSLSRLETGKDCSSRLPSLLRPEQRHLLSLNLNRSGGARWLKVQDTQSPKLFRQFQQLMSSTGRRIEDTRRGFVGGPGPAAVSS
jgi:hypothetical protein